MQVQQPSVDIEKIYDDTIAEHYDRDEFGLLRGARGRFVEQLRVQAAGGSVRDTLDLAVGTAESLLAVRELFPESALHGVDLSAKMLAVAKAKLPFTAIHDDVNNAARHFAPASFDLLLMHFLTTFIDGRKVVQETAKLLRSGGLYSIVSTTYEAFPALHDLVLRVVPEEFLGQASPNPHDPEVVASFLRDAGLEIVALEQFEADLSFADFFELYDFGLNSGFFTHIIAQAGPGKVAEFQALNVPFPVVDRYKAAIVLARKP